MRVLHKFLKAFILVLLAACSFRVFALYNDYIRHPELYAAQSAPWYTSIILTVILTALMIIIAGAACFVVGHIIKKRKQEQPDNEITNQIHS